MKNTKIPFSIVRNAMKEQWDGMVSSEAVAYVKAELEDYMDAIAKTAVKCTEHRRAKTITVEDVKLGLEKVE